MTPSEKPSWVRGRTPQPISRGTIVRGTCLVYGRHPADSREAAECPLLSGRITPEENARRAGRGTGVRSSEYPGAYRGIQAPEISPPLPPAISGGSDTKTRDRAIASGRAFTPGRPKHTPEALRLAARRRQRRRRLKRRQGSPLLQGASVTEPESRLGRRSSWIHL